MLSYEYYAVVNDDGQFLTSYSKGAYSGDMRDARLYLSKDFAETIASEMHSTVMQVTIVVAPLPTAE